MEVLTTGVVVVAQGVELVGQVVNPTVTAEAEVGEVAEGLLT